MSNTILLKGYPVKNEAPAGEEITPGMLVEIDGEGELAPHGNEGGNAAPYFAKERDHQSVDTDIPAGEVAGFWVCPPGTEVLALLAAGENVAVGEFLESDGEGALQEHDPQAVDEGGSAEFTIQTRAVVAQAVEAVDNGAGEDPVRIKVRVV